jgi:4-diphosphocytidyl-2-C-methyl-D-erythritol kinase
MTEGAVAGDAGFAPAKLNLALHVTGRRPDGYHLLDSLVAFAAVGDRVSAEAADRTALVVEGPEAAALAGEADNLVLRAARAFGPAPPVRLRLWKALPAAAGLGGGSADAAATLRVLSTLWRRPVPGPADVLALGADVPVCLVGRPVRMRGIGEVLSPVPPLPPVWVVLANPRVAVPTATVFAALDRRDNPPLPDAIPAVADVTALAGWLAAQRNDLEAPARRLFPDVALTLAAVAATPGCLLARMSGSGATCFGLFASAKTARAAAAELTAARPGWWVAAAALLS